MVLDTTSGWRILRPMPSRADPVEVDAEEFGRYATAVGWRLGLLVARNVEPDRGHGGRANVSHETFAKVSAAEFAKRAGTSAARVLRYYRAWNLAADDGVVKLADGLMPGDEPKLPNDEAVPWTEYYTQTLAVKHPEASVSRSQDPIKQAVHLAGQGMSFRQIGAALGRDEKIFRTNPTVREASTKARPSTLSTTHDIPTVACSVASARELVEDIEWRVDDLTDPRKYTLSASDRKRIVRAAEHLLEVFKERT